MKDFSDITINELLARYNKLYNILSKKINQHEIDLLLCMERQLVIEEYCPRI